MNNSCLDQLLEQNDRLYRLLDRSLNGTLYTQRLNPDGSTSIDPPIDPLPPASATAPNAMRAHLGRLVQLGENHVRGATYAAGAGMDGSGALDDERSVRDTIRDAQGLLDATWFGGGRPGTLADIIRALRVGKETDEGLISDKIQELLGTGSDANSILNTLRGFLGTAVDTSLEGGQLAVALIAQAGAIAMQAQTAKELQLLNRYLSGTTAEIGAPALAHEAVLLGFEAIGSAGIPLGELARQTTGNTERIKSFLGEAAEQRRVIPLLGQILAQLGGGTGGEPPPGGAATVQLDTAQYDILRGLLECICEATNGPPPPAELPQFDESVCGPGWTHRATWRPTVSGTNLTLADGVWTLEPAGSAQFRVSVSDPSLYPVLIPLPGAPYDCRVHIGITGELAATGAAADLVAVNLDDDSLSGGRPNVYVPGADVCTSGLLYDQGASSQDIGYGVICSTTGDVQITPNNFAIFVMFQSFG